MKTSCAHAAIFAVLLVGSGAPVAAQIYGLEELIGIGLQNSLLLENAALNVTQAHARVVAARAVYEPSLALSGEYEDSELPQPGSIFTEGSRGFIGSAGISRAFGSGTILGIEAGSSQYEALGSRGDSENDSFGSSRIVFALRQPLLQNSRGLLNKARIDAAERGFDAVFLQYLRDRDRLIARIAVSYWDAFAAVRFHQVNERSLARARRLLELSRERYEDGLIDEVDVLASDAALATREVDVLSRWDIARAAEDQLKNIAFLPIDQWDAVAFDFPDDPSMDSVQMDDFATAFERALENREDLRALSELRRQALAELEARRQEARPQLSLIGRIGRGGVGEDSADSADFDRTVWAVGVQLEMPWFRRAEKAAVDAAQAALRRAENEIATAEQAIALDLRIALRDLRTASALVEAAGRARSLHERKLELEERKLEQGRSNTFTVLQYQDELELAELQQVQAVAGLQRALVQYRLAIGVAPVSVN